MLHLKPKVLKVELGEPRIPGWLRRGYGITALALWYDSHGIRTVLSVQKVLHTRAGLPTAKDRGGTSRTTTLPAPTAAPRPMVTPGRTMTRLASHTSSSSRTGRDGGRTSRRFRS